MAQDDIDSGLTWVGFPIEVVRILELTYLDQAELHFEKYVSETLAASLRSGGRFNPPGEFGALYTASDVDTAWEEISARFGRQGVFGLPPEMGVLDIVVQRGRYVDLTDEHTCKLWDIDPPSLVGTDAQHHEHCRVAARMIRVRADFIQAPSARGDGSNLPLFPDRTDSTLAWSLQAARRERVPKHLAQRPEEEW